MKAGFLDLCFVFVILFVNILFVFISPPGKDSSRKDLSFTADVF